MLKGSSRDRPAFGLAQLFPFQIFLSAPHLTTCTHEALWLALSLSPSSCSSQPGFSSTAYLFCPPPSRVKPSLVSQVPAEIALASPTAAAQGTFSSPFLQAAASLRVPGSPSQARQQLLLPRPPTGEWGTCPPTVLVRVLPAFGPFSAGSPLPHIAHLQLLPCFALPACSPPVPPQTPELQQIQFYSWGRRTLEVNVKGATNRRDRKPSGVERKARSTWSEKLFVVLLGKNCRCSQQL